MSTHVKQPIAQLSTPCSLQALRAWVKTVDVQATGDEVASTVTTTTNHIAIT